MDAGWEYARLALRLNRLLPGTVGGYTGDAALPAAVAAEPRPEPRAVAAAARALRGRLTGVPEPRRSLLDGGLTAFEHAAALLAGRRADHRTEATAYFQLAPRSGEVDDYHTVHRELAALLPGDGPLRTRLHAATGIPVDALPACTAALSGALAERADAAFGLPANRVRYRFGPLPVTARQHYLGGHVSEVHLDTSRPLHAAALAHAVAHESYPGHHTEQCLTDDACLTDHPGGASAPVVHCPNTPRAAIAEGAAELGLDVLVGPGWGGWLAEVLAGAGVRVDGELTEAVSRLRDRLRPVRQDAALLLHERRAAPDEVEAYLRRWALAPPESAAATVAFLRDPVHRCAATAYVGGREFVRRWLAGRRDPVAGYRKLLAEPWVPAALAAGIAGVNLPETDERVLVSGDLCGAAPGRPDCANRP